MSSSVPGDATPASALCVGAGQGTATVIEVLMMNLNPRGDRHLVMDMPDRQANVWNEASLARFAECIEAFAGDEALEGLVIRSTSRLSGRW